MPVGKVPTYRGDDTGGLAVKAGNVSNFEIGSVGEQVDIGRAGKGKGERDTATKKGKAG